jgi:hypothetical protein
MSVEELIPALRDLDRAGKLRVMQFLVIELAREDGALLAPEGEYAVWSPHSAFDAADSLLGVLKTEEAARHAEG